MSFLLDPPLLVAAGAVTERALPEPVATRVQRATVAVFIATSVSLYCNGRWTHWLARLCGARSGRDWMLNSGVLRFDPERAGPGTHALAAALFATYPLWPILGRRLARSSA